MTPTSPDFEARLAVVLRHDAQLASNATDTLGELDRFQSRIGLRRARARVFAAAAAVVIIIGGAFAVVALFGGGNSAHRPAPPVHHNHSKTAPPHTFGPARPLSPSVHVSLVTGPSNLGVAAFGSIWATSAGHPAGLYRISADGSGLLSQTSFPGVSPNQQAPVQIGHTIVVANGIGSDYIVFNQTGHKIGTLPNQSLGALAGNASLGWIATKPNEVARIDTTGLHIVRQYRLPVSSITGLAISPGRLWVIDSTDTRLLRVNASSGAVTGQLNLPSAPTQVGYADGAVYVTSQDNGLRRVDPKTLTITSAIFSNKGEAVPDLGSAPKGQLWAQGKEGTVTQLNPVTLRTERNIRVFDSDNAGVSGALVTANRVFMIDTQHVELKSFPAP